MSGAGVSAPSGPPAKEGNGATRTALAWMVAACAAIAASTLLAKGLGGAWAGPLHPLQVTLGRYAGAVLVLAAVWAAAPVRPGWAGVPWRLHVARNACGFGAATLMFAAAAAMPLGEATALSFAAPVVTMALAVAVMGERIDLRRWLAAGVCVAGMLVLIRPGTEAFRPAALLALGAAACMGVESLFIARLVARESPLRMLIVNNVMGLAVALPLAALVWTPPGNLGAGLMLGVGVAMVTGQASYIQALRRGRVGAVAPAFYLTLVFAALYDLAAFGVVPDAAALLGGGLIVAGALALAGARRAPPSPARR
ncbi:MAG: DMT family transporter [Paracoccaceae bacterium]